MPPLITALYGALNAIFNVILAARVSWLRRVHRTSLGEGDAKPLLVGIRAHANNAEYVPLALVMMLLAELCGGSSVLLHVIGGTLFAARIAHALGLPFKAPNVLRFSGATLTLVGIVATASYVLYLRTTF